MFLLLEKRKLTSFISRIGVDVFCFYASFYLVIVQVSLVTFLFLKVMKINQLKRENQKKPTAYSNQWVLSGITWKVSGLKLVRSGYE